MHVAVVVEQMDEAQSDTPLQVEPFVAKQINAPVVILGLHMLEPHCVSDVHEAPVPRRQSPV